MPYRLDLLEAHIGIQSRCSYEMNQFILMESSFEMVSEEEAVEPSYMLGDG
jgi:hypothetical protein